MGIIHFRCAHLVRRGYTISVNMKFSHERSMSLKAGHWLAQSSGPQLRVSCARSLLGGRTIWMPQKYEKSCNHPTCWQTASIGTWVNASSSPALLMEPTSSLIALNSSILPSTDGSQQKWFANTFSLIALCQCKQVPCIRPIVSLSPAKTWKVLQSIFRINAMPDAYIFLLQFLYHADNSGKMNTR